MHGLIAIGQGWSDPEIRDVATPDAAATAAMYRLPSPLQASEATRTAAASWRDAEARIFEVRSRGAGGCGLLRYRRYLGATHPSNLACPVAPTSRRLDTRLTAAAPRWRRGVDVTDRANLHHPSGVSKLLSRVGHRHRRTPTTTDTTADSVQHRSGSDDAPTQTAPAPQTAPHASKPNANNTTRARHLTRSHRTTRTRHRSNG